MVRLEGFEPPTCCSGGNRSIHLSYRRTRSSLLPRVRAVKARRRLKRQQRLGTRPAGECSRTQNVVYQKGYRPYSSGALRLATPHFRERRRAARTFAACLLGVALLLVSPLPAWPWGNRGHQLVNAAAIESLPEPLRTHFRARKLYLMEHASDPDLLAKNYPAERPHHFTNADALEAYPFPHLRAQFVVEGRPPTARQAAQGDSIWQIDLYTRRLSDDWRRGQWEQAEHDAIFLAHYACDLTQPLHTLVNYDGQFTNQAGIHARFETEMVNEISERWAPSPVPAQLVDNVRARIFSELEASYGARTRLFSADSEAVKGRSYADPAYQAAFYKLAAPLAKDRLEAAVSFVSSLWYTAWVRAGKPQLGLPESRP
jgi:S1/P1 Nuclease